MAEKNIFQEKTIHRKGVKITTNCGNVNYEKILSTEDNWDSQNIYHDQSIGTRKGNPAVLIKREIMLSVGHLASYRN